MTGRYNTLLPPPRRLWFVCVFVNKISQKVMNGFQWHFQKMLMGQGTADNILVMVRILGRLWPLTIPRSQPTGLWSWSNPLCYVTLYYHCLQYIYIYHPTSLSQYVGKWAAWSAPFEVFSSYICNWVYFISPRCANSRCTMSILRRSRFFLFAVIQGSAAQIALEMEETGQFHLVDLVRHVLSGWFPKWLWKLIQILITTVSYWNVTTSLSAI